MIRRRFGDAWTPSSKRAVVVPAVVAALLLLLPWADPSPVLLDMAILVFIYALLGAGWNILGGYCGQVSFGHAIFFGIGAYAPVLLATYAHLSPWLGIAVGIVCSAAVAVLLGAGVFRLGGHYFAIATIAAAEVVQIVFTNWPWAGGAAGIQLPILTSSLANLQWSSELPYYYLCLAFLALGLVVTYVITRSRIGYFLVAIREDQEAARSLGISPWYYKQVALVLSAALAALAGSMYAQYILLVNPASTFDLTLSIQAVLITVLGGSGMIYGPLIGAAVLIPMEQLSRTYLTGVGGGVDVLVYGLLIMILAAFRPDGLIGLFTAVTRRRAEPQEAARHGSVA